MARCFLIPFHYLAKLKRLKIAKKFAVNHKTVKG